MSVGVSILGSGRAAHRQLETLGMKFAQPKEYYDSRSQLGGSLPVAKLNELLRLPFVYHVELGYLRANTND